MTEAPIQLTTYHGLAARDIADQVLPVFATVFAEPPYDEGPDDVAAFAKFWDAQTSTGFARSVVAAASDGTAVGFSFGHLLPPNNTWWDGAATPLPPRTTDEPLGRSFAVIELAVLPDWRGQGIGRSLHTELLAGVATQRAVLLVRPEPETEPARAAYRSWGYTKIGEIRPGNDKPRYDAMTLDFREGAPNAGTPPRAG